MQCPVCGNFLSERGCFCKACSSQAKCLACKALLEKDAVACVECGARVGERSAQDAPAVAVASMPVALAANRNTLSYREDRNSRVCEASLTDEAMQSLGDVFGELFVRRDGARTAAAVRRHLDDDGNVVDGHKQLAAPEVPTGVPAAPAVPVVPGAAANPSNPDSPRISHILVAKGDTFEVSDNRVKAKNASDYTRRMTYLYLYAQECSGRSLVPDKDLRTFLKSAKAIDGSGNANRWLAKHIGYSPDGEDNVKLIALGREVAKKALTEALDQSVPDPWNPDKHQPKKRTKKKA